MPWLDCGKSNRCEFYLYKNRTSAQRTKQQMTKHALFVCTTCASTWQDGKRIGTSGGEQLLDSISRLHETWELRDEFSLHPVQCMSACSHACAVSFAAPGKWTYLFGDISTGGETGVAVLECASKYYDKPDGLVPWGERPEPLKKGIIARVPPVPTLTGANT